MNDIYRVLKYIKEYIEDPKVIKDPMLQKIYVGAAAKANKLSKKYGTHYVLYDPSQSKLAVVAKSNLKSEVKEKGLTKDTAVLYVAKSKKEVNEVAPSGWEGTVKAMKKSGDVDNPWALAWWMKNKGHKSHKMDEAIELKEFNKAHFLNLIKQEIDSLKGQIAYSNDALRQKDIEDWEKKEFKAVLKDKVKDLAKTIKHYKRVQSMKEGQLDEKAKRDYKAEYKKFQSSKKSKKYRAELNAYNRKKGTYGNGDGKDASHKGGKIVGFEKESKNRGRREKSRLKKEGVWQLPRGFKASDVDELDAELYRAGLRGAKPDFNKGTITWDDKPGRIGGLSRIKSILKKHKATLIKESGAQIAKTILQQLGGNRFIAMTGAKNLGHSSKGLQMKIGRNSKGITHVVINLKSSDLYEMEFIKIRGTSRTVVKKVSGVYNDQLGKIFKKYTGLNIRL